jgi:hypothetical protein
MNTRSSKEYRYIFTTTWKQASTLHLSSRLTDNASGKLLIIFIFILFFWCCQLPFCEFTKHTTALRYRYDMQMYCTFVLFVNQHLTGATRECEMHCTSLPTFWRDWLTPCSGLKNVLFWGLKQHISLEFWEWGTRPDRVMLKTNSEKNKSPAFLWYDVEPQLSCCCVFVRVVTFLPSHCPATIGAYTD